MDRESERRKENERERCMERGRGKIERGGYR